MNNSSKTKDNDKLLKEILGVIICNKFYSLEDDEQKE